MIALEVFVVAVAAVVGAWWLRGAVSTWRGGPPLSSHPFFRVQSTQRKRHIDRCSMAAALAVLCWAVTIFCAIFEPDAPARPAPAVSVGLFLGFLGCAASGLCVVAIRFGGHPRLLIPPPLR